MKDFYDLKFRDENAVVADLLTALEGSSAIIDQTAITAQATQLIENIRARQGDMKGFNALMQSYDLTSDEGLALMTLAEALLRIPDIATANDLIADKLSDGDWSSLFEQASSFTGTLSGMGLSLSQKIMDSLVGKIGMPFIRKACVEAMQLMGRTFVLGRDIEEAIDNAKAAMEKGYIYNFDMLGEGARTSKDADYYFEAYIHAIRTIGQSIDARGQDALHRPGISIKLSALYPRYDAMQKDKAVRVLTDRLLELCIIAAEYRLNLTVDAEECDRLSLSLQIIENILKNPVTANWDGFGMAVQAYHKRAPAVIDRALEWVKTYNRKLSVRLVKGAYWDTEIKHAQVEGHPGYPVFTRKENTDLCYLACAQKLLDHRDYIYPMFGTHNAQTCATLIAMAGANPSGFIFQRLHGMGEQLHDQLLDKNLPVCVYAPVGTHQYLLAYLVRRLLENGANSSFVNKVYDTHTPVSDLTISPIDLVRRNEGNHSHPHIPLPSDIYSNRRNSRGIDLSEDVPLQDIFQAIERYQGKNYPAPSLVNGQERQSPLRYDNLNPANHQDKVGDVWYAAKNDVHDTYTSLVLGFQSWNAIPVADRAAALDRIADLYEAPDHMHEMIALLVREAGKTIADAVAEIREAVDFCRYYAVQARMHFDEQDLEGPTGERNTLRLEGRGVWACISPWNFPLAIFTGQIVAALVAGNAVIAKPAEQTPAIAAYAVQLMIRAGIPPHVIALVQGDGEVGSVIIDHDALAGVAFTGSTAVAKLIQRQLAAKDGAIIPLIAETGGLNAMIVDSSALPEQVTDDVLHSAFGSAGQRCSALRILCVQDDVADEIIPMIQGAMDHLVVGDPAQYDTDIGPIIDEEALSALLHHKNTLDGTARSITLSPFAKDELDLAQGTFIPAIAAEITDIDLIKAEAFGPILHIIRYAEETLEDLITAINAKGFGLTFGLHSRIHMKQDKIAALVNAGNIYINRGQTGAVVGVQPFGGRGLSGTGPKAGGPYYLHAFATEKSISNDITASGGNATLVNL